VEFKVGDLVTCKEKGRYSITDKGCVCEVVDICKEPRYDLSVQVIKVNQNQLKRFLNQTYVVDSKNFELVDTKIDKSSNVDKDLNEVLKKNGV
jgi:hypothetical protein